MNRNIWPVNQNLVKLVTHGELELKETGMHDVD
jgi:hypothetical protein